MIIGIMGAMEEEIKPLLGKFDKYKKVEYKGKVYYEVSYFNNTIIITHSMVGKVFSAMTATILIEHFNCEKILFTGVAGGINPKLKIGDLIVGNKLVQHDVDITVFGHPFGYISNSSVFIETDAELNSLLISICKEENIDIIEGIIATGDQFVSSKERKDFIQTEFNADALEMEGCSVANVCETLNVPCLILRSISDTADEEANFNFEKFLQEAANNSSNLMFKLINKIIKNK